MSEEENRFSVEWKLDRLVRAHPARNLRVIAQQHCDIQGGAEPERDCSKALREKANMERTMHALNELHMQVIQYDGRLAKLQVSYNELKISKDEYASSTDRRMQELQQQAVTLTGTARVQQEHLDDGRTSFNTRLASNQAALDKANSELGRLSREPDTKSAVIANECDSHHALLSSNDGLSKELNAVKEERDSHDSALMDVQKKLDDTTEQMMDQTHAFDERLVDGLKATVKNTQSKLDDTQVELDGLKTTAKALRTARDSALTVLWDTVGAAERPNFESESMDDIVQLTAEHIDECATLVRQLMIAINKYDTALAKETGVVDELNDKLQACREDRDRWDLWAGNAEGLGRRMYAKFTSDKAEHAAYVEEREAYITELEAHIAYLDATMDQATALMQGSS